MVKESYVSIKLAGFQRYRLLTCGGANRRARSHYIGTCFEPRAGVGVNTATVEYTPHADSCALIGKDSLLTLEAGANYESSFDEIGLMKGMGQRVLRELFILEIRQF
jgi:hypothetical protein